MPHAIQRYGGVIRTNSESVREGICSGAVRVGLDGGAGGCLCCGAHPGSTQRVPRARYPGVQVHVNSDEQLSGDLLFALADEGRLVIDATRADPVLTSLELAICMVKLRLRALAELGAAESPTGAPPVTEAQAAAEFALLVRAATELPKFHAAVRVARWPEPRKAF